MTRFVSVLLLAVLFVVGTFAQTVPAPTELRVSPMNGTARVGAIATWRGVSGGAQYRVYRSANDSSSFAAIGTSTTTMYVDTTIVRGTRFFYYVKAFVGTTESNRSNIANIFVPIPPPLPTPSGLTATLAVQGFEPSVKLNWRGGRGPWTYRIYRSTNDSLHYRSYAATGDTSLTDRSVRADSVYYYYVRAAYINDTTQSPRSNVARILVTAPRRPRGTVRGTIIDDSTGAPISRVSVFFYRSPSNWCGNEPTMTDSLGRYSALLDTGRYIIRASKNSEHNSGVRYRSEYFDNCLEPRCATIVTVGDSTTFTANFGLARLVPPTYVNVSGVVRDTANNLLRRARVSIIRTLQEMNFLASLGMTPGVGEEAFDLEGVGHTRGVVWNGWTDSLGRYSARVIANNRYIAMASKETYLPEYFNNKPTADLADIIVLTNRDTSGISFSLAVRPIPNNSVSGVVRDSLGTLVPSRITLIPGQRNLRTRYGHTDSLGAYTIAGVEAGKYFVLASPFSNYGHALYKAGAYGVRRIADADTVNVLGNITGINVGVRRINSGGLTLVSGRIRTTGNAAIAGVRVTAVDDAGELLGVGVTDATGTYAIDAVASGVVTVIADRDGYNAGETIIVITNTFTMNNVNITLTPEGTTSVSGSGVAPEAFSLNQNYPNPFNPSTTISFQLPTTSRVNLQVFNLLGQQVVTLVNGDIAAGTQSIVWNGLDNSGRAVASGMYFYKLNATSAVGGKEFSSIRKMLLLK
jgi:hypothetical protein